MTERAVLWTPPTLLLGWTLLAGCGGPPAEPPLPALPDAVAPSPSPAAEARPARRLAITLTGELRGELEPCGCPTLPYGGFARRARLLAQLERPDRPLFQLDAGETLLKGLSSTQRQDTAQRAALIVRLMVEVGVDVMAPGPSDLRTLGLAGLRALPGEGLRLSSATWVDEAGERPFPAALVLERGGLRLGVIGLSGPPPEGSGLRALDPVQATREALASLPEDLDLIVALSNQEEGLDRALLAQVEGLGLLLRGRGAAHDPPREEARGLVVETPDRGRYLTRVELLLAAPPGAPARTSGGAGLEGLLSLEERVLKLGGQGAGPALAAELAQLQVEVAQRARGQNLVVVEDRPLGSELDGEVALSPLLEAYKRAQLGAARAGVAAEPAAGSTRYTGSGACVRCHSLQSARWTYTAHASAAVSLLERAAHQDPECVACHTTGFGEPGGFAELGATQLRAWGGVQCEACHGPLGGHPRDARVQPEPVREQTCLRCHDEANSPEFDYRSYLTQVICPADPEPLAAEGAPDP